ncbi:MAG: hypothetical protein Q9O62_13155 [Ardenticatenia bacterium]|nr:hypothetical protein [Ardenticatenia bacterium]
MEFLITPLFEITTGFYHATDPRTGEVSNVAVLLTGVDKEAEQRLSQNEWNMLKTAFENLDSSPEPTFRT